MKRLSILMMMIVLLMAGCGNSNVPKIEEYDWTMFSVQSGMDGQAIVYGERGSNTLTTAKMIEFTCAANNGDLTITDKTNNMSYSGRYRLKDTSPQSVVYDVVIEGKEGMAVVAMTTYHDAMEEPTFIIRLEDYVVNFYAE